MTDSKPQNPPHEATGWAPGPAPLLAEGHVKQEPTQLPSDLTTQPEWTPRAGTVEDDLRSRLACVLEATSWDRPYDERLDAIRGMCDLTTDGMTAIPVPAELAALRQRIEALANRPCPRGGRHSVGPCVCEVIEPGEVLALLDAPTPAAPTGERCPDCGHVPHEQLGFCPNMASDNDCDCTHGPGAPTGEDRVMALQVARTAHEWPVETDAGLDHSRCTCGARAPLSPGGGLESLWYSQHHDEALVAAVLGAAPTGEEAGLRGLSDAATPGEWTWREEHGRDYTDEGWSYVAVESSGREVAATAYPGDREEGEAQADAAFIVAAVNHVRATLAPAPTGGTESGDKS